MNIKILRNYLKASLENHNFVLNGTRWEMDAGTFIKVIVLQKSQFGDQYYINYGFIIKDLPLEGIPMHVCIGLGEFPIRYSKSELDLLNFENQKYDNHTQIELIYNALMNPLINYLNCITEIDDIKKLINDLPTLNGIPLITKSYFCIVK